MAVYVDHPVRYDKAPRAPSGVRMVMCHMLADTPEELHAMAEKLGLHRKWYQRDASTPHYDVCKSKRVLAIELGAIECNRREIVEVIRRIRKNKLDWG